MSGSSSPSDVRVPVPGGEVVGRRVGSGRPVLALHGGPSLGFGYLDPAVSEVATDHEVVTYQQRSLAPSTTAGPFTVSRHVEDAVRVLDALGWERATVVGHSWGGHLGLHLALAHPDRVSGLACVDPLGGVGDGGAAGMEVAFRERLPGDVMDRVEELEAGPDAATEVVQLEMLRLLWPGYYADPAHVEPFPEAMGMSVEGYLGTWQSIQEELPALESELPSIAVPTTFLCGGGSPIPVSASSDTAARMPDAEVVVVGSAGHFPWWEAPGSVAAALASLESRAGLT